MFTKKQEYKFYSTAVSFTVRTNSITNADPVSV